MRKILKWLPVLLTLSACSSYGWAARTDGAPVLAVATVDIEPHTGVDAGLLTRHLMEALGDRGVATRWGQSKNPLRCRVDLWDQEAFGAVVTIRAQAICSGMGEDISRVARSQATLGPDEPLKTIREQAALAALSLVAAPVAQENHGKTK